MNREIRKGGKGYQFDVIVGSLYDGFTNGRRFMAHTPRIGFHQRHKCSNFAAFIGSIKGC